MQEPPVWSSSATRNKKLQLDQFTLQKILEPVSLYNLHRIRKRILVELALTTEEIQKNDENSCFEMHDSQEEEEGEYLDPGSPSKLKSEPIRNYEMADSQYMALDEDDEYVEPDSTSKIKSEPIQCVSEMFSIGKIKSQPTFLTTFLQPKSETMYCESNHNLPCPIKTENVQKIIETSFGKIATTKTHFPKPTTNTHLDLSNFEYRMPTAKIWPPNKYA